MLASESPTIGAVWLSALPEPVGLRHFLKQRHDFGKLFQKNCEPIFSVLQINLMN
jgi:hypothetical protein